MNNKFGFKSIATKISYSSYEILKAIAAKGNVKIYNLLQVVIDAYIKCFYTDEIVTERVQEIVRNFADFSKLKNGFCLSCPNNNQLEMHSFLGLIKERGKTDPDIILISKDKDGNITECRNNDKILLAFLQAFSPALIQWIERIKIEENKTNLTDALKFSIYSMLPQDTLHNEIVDLFSDNERTENGSVLTDVGKYKRTINTTMESMDKKIKTETTDIFDMPDIIEPLETNIEIEEP